MSTEPAFNRELTPGEVDLAAAIARREVVPFIGSGVSKQASIEAGLPNAFPDWQEFVRALVQQSGHPTLAEAVPVLSGGFPELLQVLIDDTGTRADVAEVIRHRFGDAVPYEEIVGRARLLDLLRELRPPFVLTTNYDKLLERLWPSTPVLDLEVTGLAGILEYLSDPDGSTDTPRAIIKVHGTVEDQDRATVSARDYRRLFTDTDAVQALFLWIGQRHSFWFLGYSLSDTDVQSALLTLQSRVPYRQHFWHKPEFAHPLEPRVSHVQFSVRSFEMGGEQLTSRVASITELARQLDGAAPAGLFRSTEPEFSRAVTILSRFELPESQVLAGKIMDAWYGEIRDETDDWNRVLPPGQWWRLLVAERVLRHLLFLADRFEERKHLGRYILAFSDYVPPELRLDAAGAIAEGLGYLEENEHALVTARELIERHSDSGPRRDLTSLALAVSLVARSTARWKKDPGEKWVALDKVVRAAAQARAPEFHAACLLDRAQIAVAELVREQDRADRRLLSDGVVAARAALELALYGGSNRRASIALQRLAFLDEEASHFWAGQAVKLQREMHFPPEPRNKLYLDCAVAVSLWRTRQRHYARTVVARYDDRWFAAHALPSDHAFFQSVTALLER